MAYQRPAPSIAINARYTNDATLFISLCFLYLRIRILNLWIKTQAIFAAFFTMHFWFGKWFTFFQFFLFFQFVPFLDIFLLLFHIHDLRDVFTWLNIHRLFMTDQVIKIIFVKDSRINFINKHHSSLLTLVTLSFHSLKNKDH